jgi:adenosine deaminase CECR1
MNSNETLIEKTEAKRVELIQEINKEKYSYINVSPKDNQANELFLQKIVQTFIFPEDYYYNLAMKYKTEIENNEFFKDLQFMPKGCLLHHHMNNCIDTQWISEEVMKKNNLKNIYMRKMRTYDILVYTTKPNENDKLFKNVIEQYLNENKNKTAFDYFHSKLSMSPEEIDSVKNNSEAWNIFSSKMFFCYYLVLYKEFYKQHIRNTFLQCIKDKQYRLESRITIGEVLNEDFTPVSYDEEFSIYQKEVDYINKNLNLETKFTFGVIIQMIRNKTDEFLKKSIEDSIFLKKKYPELICGLDLSGNEDKFRNFLDLTPVMLNNNEPELPWLLHCGETIKGSNYNLVDGILNKAKRLGHVVNLFKLGNLWKYVQKNNIILEINPISNQNLRLVRDLRMHPCIGYHNNGLKICINNDDATIENTKGVCYDFFVSFAIMEFDLIDFKSFCLNSIEGAQIPNELKNEYKLIFKKDWDSFLDYFIKKYES